MSVTVYYFPIRGRCVGRAGTPRAGWPGQNGAAARRARPRGRQRAAAAGDLSGGTPGGAPVEPPAAVGRGALRSGPRPRPGPAAHARTHNLPRLPTALQR
jgi:hypothetical protein